MIKIESKMFRDSRKSAVSDNIAVNIATFVFMLLLMMIAESIIPLIMSYDELKLRLLEEAENSDINRLIEISAEINLQPKYLIPTLFCTVFGTAIAVIYCRFVEARHLSSMGIQRKKLGIHYLQGAAIGLFLMSFIVLISVVTGVQKISVCSNVNIKLIILFLFGFFFQGMSEEFIFRGYFMNTLGGRHHWAAAVGISAAAFSLSHGLNPGFGILVFINLFLFGAFAGLYMLYFDDIWGVSAIHSVWNFAQGNLFGISVSGTGNTESLLRTTANSSSKLLTGGDFGIEGSIITTVVLGAAIAVIFILHNKKSKTSRRREN